MIVKPTGYVKRAHGIGKTLNRHFKYLQYRAPDEPSSAHNELFDETGSTVTRIEARERILKLEGTVAYHKLVLAPSVDEHIEDWQAWTAQVMADLARSKAMDLTWVASFHAAEGHPHVHVVVAGSGTTATGRRQGLVLRLDDYKYLTERAGYHAERSLKREITGIAQSVIASAKRDTADVLTLSRELERTPSYERSAI